LRGNKERDGEVDDVAQCQDEGKPRQAEAGKVAGAELVGGVGRHDEDDEGKEELEEAHAEGGPYWLRGDVGAALAVMGASVPDVGCPVDHCGRFVYSVMKIGDEVRLKVKDLGK